MAPTTRKTTSAPRSTRKHTRKRTKPAPQEPQQRRIWPIILTLAVVNIAVATGMAVGRIMQLRHTQDGDGLTGTIASTIVLVIVAMLVPVCFERMVRRLNPAGFFWRDVWRLRKQLKIELRRNKKARDRMNQKKYIYEAWRCQAERIRAVYMIAFSNARAKLFPSHPQTIDVTATSVSTTDTAPATDTTANNTYIASGDTTTTAVVQNVWGPKV
jgi:hypothetical protein